MYAKFFNFSRKPFSSEPDPDFFYQTSSAQKVCDKTVKAIQQHEPCLLLTGEPGTGKTVLLRRLMADLKLKIHWIFIDLAMEISGEDHCSDDLLEYIKERVTKFDSKAAYQVTIIDEINYLEKDTIENLLQWQTSKQKEGVVFTIIFSGTHQAANILLDSEQGIFSCPPKYHLQLETFSYKESCELIDYRLKIVKHKGSTLFEDDALELIHQLSAGVPRKIIQICELGLFLAAYHKQQIVTGQYVRKAANYLLVNKDTGSGEVLPLDHPLIDSPLVEAAHHKNDWQVYIWRAAAAGLLIMLGGGAYYLRSLPSQNQEDISPSLTPQSSSNDLTENTKQTVILTTGASDTLDAEPEIDSSQLATEEMPTETDPTELLLETLPPPAAGFDKELTTGYEIAPPSEQAPTVVQVNLPQPPEIETNIDEQSFSEIGDPLAASDESTNQTVPITIASTDYRYNSAAPTAPVPVVPQNAMTHTEFISTDLYHQPIPEMPTEIVSKPPSPTKSQTKQGKAATKDKELGNNPSVSVQPKKIVTSKPVQSPKQKPVQNTIVAAITPEPPKVLPTSQNRIQDNRIASSPKGMELLAAAENGNLVKIQQLLDKGTRVNSVNDTGETALMKAAWTGHTDIVTLLLSHNPQINRQSQDGWTALFFGAVKGHKVIVEVLLARGANPDTADLDGRTPLMAAIWNGHADIARMLLGSNIDPNRKNRDGWSALMFAALKGHVDVAQILLLHGADPFLINSDGQTCSQLAARQGHDQFVSFVTAHSKTAKSQNIR